jgi:hypothetical protein
MCFTVRASSRPNSPVGWFDEGVEPGPYITAGEGGRVYFKMVPTTWGRKVRTVGVGRAYKVDSGADELLWEVDGWYSAWTLLSRDGRYLVRLQKNPRGREVSDDDLAVAFYDRGKLLRKYSTRQLIEDDSKVRRSTSHYMYLGANEPLRLVGLENPDSYPRHGFSLVTIEGVRYQFDIRTGDVKGREKLESQGD